MLLTFFFNHLVDLFRTEQIHVLSIIQIIMKQLFFDHHLVPTVPSSLVFSCLIKKIVVSSFLFLSDTLLRFLIIRLLLEFRYLFTHGLNRGFFLLFVTSLREQPLIFGYFGSVILSINVPSLLGQNIESTVTSHDLLILNE